ncbi:putative quinol monooxygenase [Streptomyces sp. NPDC055078]
MIIISGKITVAPEARDAYLTGCHQVIEQARTAPGCLDFSLSADLLEPGRINIYERWESDAHLAKFRGSGPDAGQTAEILDADVAKYRISSTEAP